MTRPGLLVFATFEVFPFTGGGIGRLTYNMLKSMTSDERQRTVVILTSGTIPPAAFEEVFPGVRLMEMERHDFSRCDPDLAWALQGPGGFLENSVKLLMMLQDIARTEKIDYAEFPDWSGFGFATIQQKRLTGFLGDATIAVRIHSTEAILVLFESRLLSPADLLRFDLERISLKDCDRIIGHLQPVAEFTRRVFGIEQESWNRRLVIADAPVLLNGQESAVQTVVPAHARHIVFSSKLQEFKRPEVFIRGAAQFLASDPGYEGTVNFACIVQDNAYSRALMEGVPEGLRHRFIIPKSLSVPDRDRLIAGGIAVFATVFESYCLAAYEAAALGAVVVANHNNPAFGPGTPWADGVNCITFDGSVDGLAQALGRARTLTAPLAVVERPDLPQAWHFAPAPPIHAINPPGEAGKLAAVVVNQGEGAALLATLASLFAASAQLHEIIVVDDASTDTESHLVLSDLEAGGGPVRVIRLAATHGYAAALNVALRAVSAPYAAVLRSGIVVKPAYLRDAAACLDRDEGTGIVCGQVRAYSDIDQWMDGLGTMTASLGDGSISGGDHNTFAEFGFVLRSEIARRIGFRPETGYLCDWAFMRAAVGQGVGVVASVADSIGRRTRIERDFGTPIDEFDRLRHITVTHIDTPGLQAPVMQLAMAAFRAPRSSPVQNTPKWYAHMLNHGYEPEVAFMAEFFGHSRLGLFIRSNKRFNAFMERLVNALSRLGPGRSK